MTLLNGADPAAPDSRAVRQRLPKGLSVFFFKPQNVGVGTPPTFIAPLACWSLISSPLYWIILTPHGSLEVQIILAHELTTAEQQLRGAFS